MYIAKSKIHVEKKRIGAREYKSNKRLTGYLYLDVNKRNHISMNLRIKEGRYSIKVNIPKYAVYDMLMYHLSFRPIRRPKDATVYTNEKVEAFESQMDFSNLSPDEIKREYKNAIRNLESIIRKSEIKAEQNRAQKQLDALVDDQWKIELYHAIWKGKNFKIK